MLIALLAALVALGAAACGGGGGVGSTQGAAARDRSPEAVIRAWVDTLRRGDVKGAAEYFALPSIVENGTPPLELRTRSDARAFNSALPCGAVLLRTSSSGRFTTAVFRLTERPGRGSCGSGVGERARTTFVIRDGKIREWRRVADQPQSSGPLV